MLCKCIHIYKENIYSYTKKDFYLYINTMYTEKKKRWNQLDQTYNWMRGVMMVKSDWVGQYNNITATNQHHTHAAENWTSYNSLSALFILYKNKIKDNALPSLVCATDIWHTAAAATAAKNRKHIELSHIYCKANLFYWKMWIDLLWACRIFILGVLY